MPADWVDIDEVPRRSIRRGDNGKLPGKKGRWRIIRIQHSDTKDKTILEVVHLGNGAGKIVDSVLFTEVQRPPVGAAPVRTRKHP